MPGHGEAFGVRRVGKDKPGLRRYLRRTTTGLLRIDHATATRKAHLDGKWPLRTSDVTLTPEDLSAAYKQLVAVERGRARAAAASVLVPSSFSAWM